MVGLETILIGLICLAPPTTALGQVTEVSKVTTSVHRKRPSLWNVVVKSKDGRITTAERIKSPKMPYKVGELVTLRIDNCGKKVTVNKLTLPSK